MFQNVLGSDGRMHLERQFGNQRIDLTTGETKTVILGVGSMNTVIDESGAPYRDSDREHAPDARKERFRLDAVGVICRSGKTEADS